MIEVRANTYRSWHRAGLSCNKGITVHDIDTLSFQRLQVHGVVIIYPVLWTSMSLRPILAIDGSRMDYLRIRH
jgi:hypothetical protein